jgi:hypothetical protein
VVAKGETDLGLIHKRVENGGRILVDRNSLEIIAGDIRSASFYPNVTYHIPEDAGRYSNRDFWL